MCAPAVSFCSGPASGVAGPGQQSPLTSGFMPLFGGLRDCPECWSSDCGFYRLNVSTHTPPSGDSQAHLQTRPDVPGARPPLQKALGQAPGPAVCRARVSRAPPSACGRECWQGVWVAFPQSSLSTRITTSNFLRKGLQSGPRYPSIFRLIPMCTRIPRLLSSWLCLRLPFLELRGFFVLSSHMLHFCFLIPPGIRFMKFQGV